ncbi:MerR family transcriptional regulator [Lichenihabitans psoromatis]|uniref:MerR family transcriptional regulator n=1 Tax=Lichenihabitans psoromatis TaxID=2528642 RepID=UPI001036E015|nr:MerR family transcriptional regulator [Lichenihabitans psoromatis]
MAYDQTETARLSIAELAAQYDLTLRTLRFYEKRGLLHPERVGTRRYFGPTEMKRLEFILKVRDWGFTLTEIGELLGNGKTNSDGTPVVPTDLVETQISRLERQRTQIDHAIETLQREAVHATAPAEQSHSSAP